MEEEWHLTYPRTIITGSGSLNYLKSIEGKRALIVTDDVIYKLGFVDAAIKYLNEAALEVKVFDKVESEPSVETVERGGVFAREYNPDWLIALGGGSCMDAAKAIWARYANPEIDVLGIGPLKDYGLRKKAQLICIPTTSGTGSEVSWGAVITDVKNERKAEICTREFVPDVAIIDPDFPKSMPPRLVADTGLDALTHATEAYVSQWHNDFSDSLAIRSIQTIFKYLPRSYKSSEDLEAKEKMHNAATMAGMSFSNSQTGIAHSMGHSLGAIYKIPHGRTVDIFLSSSIEYGVKEALGRYANIARAIGFEAETDEKAVKGLVKAVRNLDRELGQPASIKELGISKEDFDNRLDDLVERAFQSSCTFMNPRVPSKDDTKKLFMYAFEGKEVDF